MNLKQFLKIVNWNENDIINYEWEEAFKRVKQNWYALQFVNNQTEKICLEAVKQDWDALQFVNKNIFKEKEIETIEIWWIKYSKEEVENVMKNLKPL